MEATIMIPKASGGWWQRLKSLWPFGKKHHHIKVPAAIQKAPGIRLGDKLVKSILFSTDAAVIAYCDADAVLAVYPFAPSAQVMEAVAHVANRPVICGVGGGLTKGKQSIEMAQFAEASGAAGVVVNQPATPELIMSLKAAVGIPVVNSIASAEIDIEERIKAGVDVFNVSAGKETAAIVAAIRKFSADIPIIATGGKTDSDIQAVIKAGASAITFTPPTPAQLLKNVMARYREGKNSL